MSTYDPPSDDEARLDREAVLGLLNEQLHRVNDMLCDAELAPDDLREQEIRIKWLRTLGFLSGEYRKLMKDNDIDELEEDLELLQKAGGLTDD